MVAASEARLMLPPGFAIVVLSTIVTVLGLGVVAPVLPKLSHEFGLSGSQTGLLLSAYAAGRVVTSVPAGALMDRFGFRAVAMTALLVAAVSALAAAVEPSYTVILVVQFVQGLAAGAAVTAGHSAVMRLARADQIGRVVSMFMSATLIVMLFSPAIGGVASRLFGYAGPFWVMGVSQAVAVAVVLVAMPRIPHDEVRRAAATEERGARWRAVREVVLSRAFGISFLATFGMVWAFSGVRNTVVPLFAAEEFGMDSAQIGAVLTAAAIGGVFVLPMAGRALDRFGRRPVTRAGSWFVAGGSAILVFATTPWLLVALTFVAEAARSTLNPLQSTVIADLARPTALATTVGIGRLAPPLGMMLGPVMVGWFTDVVGFRATFGVSGVFLAAIAVACLPMPETMRPPTTQDTAEVPV